MQALKTAEAIAQRVAPRTTETARNAVRRFREALGEPMLARGTTRVVFAHDWGNDDAQNQVSDTIRKICRTVGRREIDVTTIEGIPSLATPLVGAVTLHRSLDTHIAATAFAIERLRNKGASRSEISDRLGGLVILDVFDRSVGSDRVIAAAEGRLEIDGYLIPIKLLGPVNNGIMGSLSRRLEDVRIHRIANEKFELMDFGELTWDGRKRFAPAAALLAINDIDVSELGGKLNIADYPWINIHQAAHLNGVVEAGIAYIDQIGNLKLALANEDLRKVTTRGEKIRIRFRHHEYTATLGQKFSDVDEGEWVLYPGSNGLAEVAINCRATNRIIGITQEDLDLEPAHLGSKELRPSAKLQIVRILQEEIDVRASA